MSNTQDPAVRKYVPQPGPEAAATPPEAVSPVSEIGGRRDGTEPTRYGDWEKHGRCIDF